VGRRAVGLLPLLALSIWLLPGLLEGEDGELLGPVPSPGQGRAAARLGGHAAGAVGGV